MFTPHTDSERELMLQKIGVKNLEDLFQDIPDEYRFPELDLPEALSEMEALQYLTDLSMENENTIDLKCFLGAGAYNHYIPAGVDAILRRGEFLTAYTPYQPEISQGTLQAIFEYQSLIIALTGMQVCNASHYDGATATAEAGVLAFHHYRGKRKKFIVSPSVHPQYRETLRTYMSGKKDMLISGDEADKDPLLSPDDLIPMIDHDTAMVVVQYPDFFGRIFDYTKLAEEVHGYGGLLVVVVNPTALALLKAPADFGADIVVGDGQPLGIPISYGGPYLGLFATNNELMRKIAGRLVGETVDSEGRRGYVLTLTAREQHIRRERATSNICTNQGLMALASTVYMSLLGKNGLKNVAELCFNKAHYAAQKITEIPGFNLCHDTPYFHEFAVCCPTPVSEINEALLDHGIIGGYDLGNDYPALKDHMLIAITEKLTREDIDYFCDVLKEFSND